MIESADAPVEVTSPPPRPRPASVVAPEPAKSAGTKNVAEKKIMARLEKKLERAELQGKAAERPAPAPGLGRLEVAVLPWGEVVVDGRSRGVSPPLRVLDIPAGSHTIELRNSTFTTHVEKVDVKPGEATRIRHRFR